MPSLFLKSALVLAMAGTAVPALAHDPKMAARIGEPGKAGAAARVVKIDMHAPMKYSPATITVRGGETIRFIVTNSDNRVHEFMLGEMKDLQAHAKEMQKHPEMIHDEPNAITVEPGKTGELVWTFPKSGKVDFACLLPGHFEAGMKGHVEVKR